MAAASCRRSLLTPEMNEPRLALVISGVPTEDRNSPVLRGVRQGCCLDELRGARRSRRRGGGCAWPYAPTGHLRSSRLPGRGRRREATERVVSNARDRRRQRQHQVEGRFTTRPPTPGGRSLRRGPGGANGRRGAEGSPSLGPHGYPAAAGSGRACPGPSGSVIIKSSGESGQVSRCRDYSGRVVSCRVWTSPRKVDRSRCLRRLRVATGSGSAWSARHHRLACDPAGGRCGRPAGHRRGAVHKAATGCSRGWGLPIRCVLARHGAATRTEAT